MKCRHHSMRGSASSGKDGFRFKGKALNFDFPQAKPLDRSKLNLTRLIKSASSTDLQNLVAIGSLGVSPHTWNITKKVFIFIYFFFSSDAPQTAILHRFWWMAQTTRFDARKCNLGMRTVKIHNLGIFYPQNPPKFAPTMLIKAKTNIRNNFLTVQDTPILIMNR